MTHITTHPTANGRDALHGLLAIITAALIASNAPAGGNADLTDAAPAVPTERSLSFRQDIVPILTKAGCNSGGCHGRSTGQEGFHLSLFGFDPASDYRSITRDARVRRIDLAHPARSLLLAKPTVAVAHGGGQRLDPEGVLYKTLLQWVQSGAPDDPPDLAPLTGITIEPTQSVVAGADKPVPLRVTAQYGDGSTRNVTHLARYDTSDDAVVTVNENGEVRSGGKGEAFVMVRFGTYAAVSQFIVLPAESSFNWQPHAEPVNEIDVLIDDKLRKLQINPSPPCSDGVFIRRAYLDVIGLLPTIEAYRAFMADTRPDKRSRLIDALLARPAFEDFWAMKLAELLRIESVSRRISFKAMYLYDDWLRRAIADNRPLDAIVRDLLAAEGGNFANPASNFYVLEKDPTLIAENVAQVFCGIRIQCARCHNHPFESWTQDDYYSFAAFFAQVGTKSAADIRESIVFNRRRGEVKHERTGQTMAPKLLAGPRPEKFRDNDRRAELAAWLTAKDNPYFAACFVDRVWSALMGRGIVEPPDDVRVSNPPSHPELRRRLAQSFVENGYDIRGLIRMICRSNAYQRTTQTNATNAEDVRNFSHRQPQRLPAETLLDIICQVTGVPEKFAGLPRGARAVRIADANTGSYFLEVFGRPPRQSVCTCERRNEPTLSQALHLINGDTIQGKIATADGMLAQRLSKGDKPEAILRVMYVAALCREPRQEELDALLAPIANGAEARAVLEDAFWALLNSTEFVFNH